MQFYRTPVRSLVVLVITILSFSSASFAQEAHQSFSQVHIKNFGQMDERFYRGAEPKKREDFEALKGLGISTVIDLQSDADPDEKGWVESLGMRYVNIPMVAKKYPREEHVAEFIKLVDDPSTGKFFVHCAGGRHRTGAIGAVYRFNYYGWDYDRVYKEMKQFDFYTSWGHGDFKKFVQDYWQRQQTQTPAAPAHLSNTSVGATAVSN